MINQSHLKAKSRDKAKDIFYDLIHNVNIHDIDKIMSLFSESIEITRVAFGHKKGKTKVNEFLCGLFQCFPNLYVHPLTVISDYINCILISEINFGGQQLGWFKGNPPTGKIFTINGGFAFESNKIDQINNIRIYYDSRLVYRQLNMMMI